MRLVLDIDGTLCEAIEDHENYQNAKPHDEMIRLVNKLYDAGHYIIILTARGMGTCGGIVPLAYSKWYTKTEAQVKSWGLKYHELHLGKPHGDIYIDDKAFRVKRDGSSIAELEKFLEDLDD